MAQTDSKHIKFEIESTNGTLVDVTPYISSLQIDNMEVYRIPPTMWQRIKFSLWRIWYKYFQF